MGWLGRLLGKDEAAHAATSTTLAEFHPSNGRGVLLADSPAALLPSAPQRMHLPVGGYAVIDLETTGLSPRQHRAVQVAVVLMDVHGRAQHEWSTLINPQGPVGATHIHGIRDVDVEHAPTFDVVLPHLAQLLAGRALVAHNASFDEAFLKFEFGRAGWGWPSVPTLCTLHESFHFQPNLDRRRLVDCCWAAGIRLTDAHSALGDARATASLLANFLDPSIDIPPLPEHRAILGAAALIAWPSGPGTGRIADPATAKRDLTPRARRVIAATPKPRTLTLLESFTLSDALDDGAPDGTLSYLETLLEVLEDEQVTDDERAALSDVADLYDLANADIDAAHRGFVRALAREALEDGVLAHAEKAEIHHVGELLNVPPNDLKDFLNGAEESRLTSLSVGLAPLPDGWTHGKPLHVGERVAFTGCDDIERDMLEERAKLSGVRVASAVSRRTAMLVTDGSFAGIKAAAATELGIRQVTPTEFALCLDHIQPMASPAKRPASVSTASSGSHKTAGSVGLPHSVALTAHAGSAARPSAGAVRAWARENGHDVGLRGRLSAEVWDAYDATQSLTRSSDGNVVDAP